MEEINLLDLLLFFKEKVKIILYSVLICIVVTIFYLIFIKTTVYNSSTTIMIGESINQNLMTNVNGIINSKNVIDKTIDDLSLDTNYSDISKNVIITNTPNTKMFKIDVTNKNSKVAMNIANKMVDNFKVELIRIYPTGTVKVIDEAKISNKTVNGGVFKELFLAIVFGTIVSCGIILVIYFLDSKIRTVDEIKYITSLPILGIVDIDKEDM